MLKRRTIKLTSILLSFLIAFMFCIPQLAFGEEYIHGGKVDIIICIDRSTSMDDEILEVKNATKGFCDDLESEGFDWQLGLIYFNDDDNTPKVKNATLTDNVDTFKSWISTNTEGGAEPTTRAMQEAYEFFIYDEEHEAGKLYARPDAGKMIILLTDEDYQRHRSGPSLSSLGEDLKKINCVTNFISDNSSDSQTILNKTGKGEHYDIDNGVQDAYDDIIMQIGANQPPVINSVTITPVNIMVNNTISCSASATDPDPGDSLTYAWHIYRPDNTEYFEQNSTASIVADQIGQWRIEFSVHDDWGKSASKTENINVTLGSAVMTADLNNSTNKIDLSWGMNPASANDLYKFDVYRIGPTGPSEVNTKVQNNKDAGTWSDGDAHDVAAPVQPMGITVTQNNQNLNVAFNSSSDNASIYRYYLEAKGIASGNTLGTAEDSVEVKSGIQGYSYIIDRNPSTDPDNSVDVATNSFQYTLTDVSGTYYVHIKSVDNAGNASSTTTVPVFINDPSPPNGSTNIIINNGNLYTLDRNVKITLDGTNVVNTLKSSLPSDIVNDNLEMRVYGDTDDTGWISYSNWNNVDKTLSASQGLKTVKAQFRYYYKWRYSVPDYNYVCTNLTDFEGNIVGQDCGYVYAGSHYEYSENTKYSNEFTGTITFGTVKVDKFTDRVTGANSWIDQDGIYSNAEKKVNRYFPNSEVVSKFIITTENSNGVYIDNYNININTNANNNSFIQNIEYIKVVKIVYDVDNQEGNGNEAMQRTRRAATPLIHEYF